MNIGVMGTGMVGDAIASKLVALGHDVMMGSRESNNPKAVAWAKRLGERAQAGSFEDTARFGELVFNCTNGGNSLEARRAAGEKNLNGKILIYVANILTPEERGPESRGEQIQKTFTRTKVIKALNTVNCEVMVDASKVGGTHTIFMSGNDAEAKKTVHGLLAAFGWKDIIDLGHIASARASENYLSLWLTLWKSLDTAHFNISVIR